MGRWDSATAARAFTFAVFASLLFKGLRTAELCLAAGSAAPLVALPFVIWIDVACAAALALLSVLLVRGLGPRWGRVATWLVLLPLALLLPIDLVMQRLIGEPLTFPRMFGAEGGTVANWDLLRLSDLIWVLGGAALLLLALTVVLRERPASARFRALHKPLWHLTILLLAGSASWAVHELLPRDFGLNEQPLLTFVRSAYEPDALTSTHLGTRGWAALYEPDPTKPVRIRDKPPALTGAHAKNAVIFLAEGVPYKHTSFGNPAEDPTPYLRQRHAREGLLFDRYYSPWHSSVQALFSIACGQFPPLTGNVVRTKPRIDCGELSEAFAAAGYHVGLFHGGRFSFYSKLAFFGQRGYEIEIDAEELGRTRGARLDKWGIDDRIMVDAVVNWVSTLPKDEPFIALVIPISPHYPYTVPIDVKPVFKKRDERSRFLNAVRFQDLVFERMLKGFERVQRYDDTLFAWLGDHGNAVNEPLRASPGHRTMYQPSLHTPLVLLNRRMVVPGSVSNRLGSHLDLVPTLRDGLGLTVTDRKKPGQSLLSPDYRPRRVFIGAKLRLGYLEDTEKFLYDFRSRRSELYDLEKDPDELKNLSDTLSKKELTRRIDLVERFARAVNGYFEYTPNLREKVSINDVYPFALRNLTMTLKKGKAPAVVCAVSDGQAQCGQRSISVGIERMYVQRRLRRCLMVGSPLAEETLELTFQNPALLKLLTGSILSLPRPNVGTYSITATVDGKAQPNAIVTPLRDARVEHPRPKSRISFTISGTGQLVEKTLLCLELTES